MRTIKSALLSLLGMGLMMSCSDQNLEPATPDQPSNEVTKDGIFVSLTINQRNTRTETDYYDEMEQEVGQNYENEITSAYIILADDDDNVLAYTLVKDITEENGEYAVEGTFNRKDILSFMGNEENLEELKDVKGKYVNVFVIANPTGNVTSPRVGSNVQQIISMSNLGDLDSYGCKDIDRDGSEVDNYHFLMTNADYSNRNSDLEKNVYKAFISYDKANTGYIKQDENGEEDPTDILDLGSVSVQRNLARFDLNDENKVFYFDQYGQVIPTSDHSGANPPSDAYVSVSMEYVGIVNISKTFNLFKHTGKTSSTDYRYKEKNITWYDPDNSGLLWSEMPSNERVVFDPSYDQKWYELKYYDNDNKKGWGGNYSKFFFNHYTDPQTFINRNNYDADSENGLSYGKIFTYYSHGNHKNQIKANGTSKNESEKGYFIRRYCSPNTIHDPEDQKAAISTGFVFIARLNFIKGGLGYGANSPDETPIYAWGGKFYGANYKIQQVANSQSFSNSTDQGMAAAYKAAIESATDEDTNWLDAYNHSSKSDDNFNNYINVKPSMELATALVANGFTIYEPYNIRDNDEGEGSKEYMCYYIYWNRHNDNGIEVGPNRMGNMEFGVVRNNIYKIKLTEVTTFGHPFPDEEKDYPVDPDPINPNDPDENADKTYMKVEVKVVDWTVRRSGDIKF